MRTKFCLDMKGVKHGLECCNIFPTKIEFWFVVKDEEYWSFEKTVWSTKWSNKCKDTKCICIYFGEQTQELLKHKATFAPSKHSVDQMLTSNDKYLICIYVVWCGFPAYSNYFWSCIWAFHTRCMQCTCHKVSSVTCCQLEQSFREKSFV